jgi:hypothetical protein
MILYGADCPWVVRPVPDRGFEDDSLVVAFALAFGFDAVGTGRPFLAAFYATFSTGEAAGLGPLSHLRIWC